VSDDFATVFINDVENTSWKFSLGALGGGTMKKLDAMNFYGWKGDGGSDVCGMYIDDVKFTQELALNAPTNLVATLNSDDATLTWDAPTSGTPTSYCIVRNDEVLINGVTLLNYADNSLYPNQYIYAVRALYAGIGYSVPTNLDTVT